MYTFKILVATSTFRWFGIILPAKIGPNMGMAALWARLAPVVSVLIISLVPALIYWLTRNKVFRVSLENKNKKSIEFKKLILRGKNRTLWNMICWPVEPSPFMASKKKKPENKQRETEFFGRIFDLGLNKN